MRLQADIAYVETFKINRLLKNYRAEAELRTTCDTKKLRNIKR